MAIILPILSDTSPRFYYQITLGDTTFTLSFAWNDREAAWFLSILASDGETVILSNIRLSIGYSLLSQYVGVTGIPKGEMMVVDTQPNNAGGVIEFDNIGIDKRFQLMFATNEEIGV